MTLSPQSSTISIHTTNYGTAMEYTNPIYGDIPRDALVPLVPMEQYTPYKMNNEYVRPVMHPIYGLVNLGESGQLYPHPQGKQTELGQRLVANSGVPTEDQRRWTAELPTEFAPRDYGVPNRHTSGGR